MKRVLLLNSGGPDSACVGAWLDRRGFDVFSVFVDLGQSNREAAGIAAKETARRWCSLGHHVATVDVGGDPSYVEDNNTFSAPGLAMTCLSIGSMIAGMRGYPEVYSGLAPALVGAKNTERWGEALNYAFHAVRVNTKPAHRIFPLWEVKKADEAAWAGITNEDLRYTVTCGAAIRDDTCVKCIERREAGIPV